MFIKTAIICALKCIVVLTHSSLGCEPKYVFSLDNIESIENHECVMIVRINANHTHSTLHNLTRKYFQKITNVETIDLKNNTIKDIEPGTFLDTTKLTRINLNANLLTKITAKTFGKILSLKNLYLSYNNLRTIESKAFDGLYKIQVLEMKNNELKYIDENAFRFNSTLYWLSIPNNLLTELSFVRNLHNLSKLDCNSNKITNIAEDIFRHVTKVEDLQCANNEIENVSFLNSLVNLKYLDLSANSIADIPLHTFAELKELIVLNLSGNKLKTIRTGTFKNLLKLESLYLNKNELTFLGEIFEMFPNLRVFDFRNNRLQELPKDLSNPTFNFTIHLDGNNWKCSFIRMLVSTSENRLKYTPVKNETYITNIKSIACTDDVSHNDGEPPRALPPRPTLENSTPSTFEIPTYVVILAILFGLCSFAFLSFILYRKCKFGRSSRPVKYDVVYPPKYDSDGYLLPSLIPPTEPVYEEIILNPLCVDPSYDRSSHVSLSPSTRMNIYQSS